jgi:hypothetical protein
MKSFGRVSRQCTSAICVIALLATSFAYALGQQNRPKRALTHQDYDSWHSIQSPQIIFNTVIVGNGAFSYHSFTERNNDYRQGTYRRIIKRQPDDSSYDDIVRELAFDLMVQSGLKDSDERRTISNDEMERRIKSWQK